MKRGSTPMTRQVTETSKKPVEGRERKAVDPKTLFPTGSTLFNCSCSDHPHAGFQLGKLVNLIGDSSSGKSFLALTCLAKIAHSSRFDKYDLFYDDAEHAAEFDLDYLFGPVATKRVEQIGSHTIQHFRKKVSSLINKKRKFIYVLDSFDNLTSDEELKRLAEEAKKTKEDKKGKGSYGTEKVRGLNELLRKMCEGLKRLDSSVIVVSQVRDKIGSSFPMKTRTGGHQLRHNSTHEAWMSIVGKEYKKDTEIGVKSRVKLTKNKLTGKVGKGRVVDFSIFNDYGVDDVGSCVDWLAAVHWDKEDKTIKAEEFNVEGTRLKVIRFIEREGAEAELEQLVGQVWNEREEALRVKRKPRFP